MIMIEREGFAFLVEVVYELLPPSVIIVGLSGTLFRLVVDRIIKRKKRL